ncbi:MAG: D-glycerate dehydrogenase [Burkholderiaceae bacterium]|jgi:gluconate 2-dehydrogenase|uniref:2-hydroxyacid dehydrogenase n=1 Tax=Polynucleobacter sp. HIN8 TaxID=3047867 RepID=UPI001DA05AEB|nr:D-glycerate dehydrogenase [Polynucleobacter sp. HIN8]MBU6321803.1 D-glycerate dehydrogenase [Burkholderiales bacterium]NBO86698.1 D-glycerate dehydrogenase [Burkholderiaceae bacterium]NBP96915.1 D-glycerate dehydrogenase [Burkholderiaceae bacterium]NCA09854.1 D-glycerate dehydrogenase [Burkholderiaceae bacterium]NCU93162.1 D-glycerate dehydrogenase [Burkholderiaceae bacterium]
MTTKPKILVARAIFPDALAQLEEKFEVQSNQADDIFSPEQLRKHLAEVKGALVFGSERIDRNTLSDAKDLKIVANISVGYNNFDVPAMTAAGVMATNTPDVLTDTTADFGFALLMATARRITESEHWIRNGQWDKMSIVYNPLGMDLHHTTLGIIGMGRIGQGIAKRALGFGMKVMYHNRKRLSETDEKACGARYVDKETLLREADHVVLVVPYSAESHHLIGAKEIALMKPTATLVNIARGGIVDDAALAAALKAKTIFAAGLDVYEGEPKVHPELLKLSNVVLAPHIASATEKTRRAMVALAIDNLNAALEGKRPPSLINTELWKN